MQIQAKQTVQNKAVRFITDTSLRDRISSKSLHERLKLDPVNVKLNKLKNKSLNKLHILYIKSDVRGTNQQVKKISRRRAYLKRKVKLSHQPKPSQAHESACTFSESKVHALFAYFLHIN